MLAFDHRKNTRVLTLCITIALGLLSGTRQAQAMELWEPHLPGLDSGLAGAALPPEGLYGVVNSYWAHGTKFDNAGNKTSLTLDALIVVPVVLWSTGVKVLGADYAVALSQPYDYTNVKLAGESTLSNNGHWGSFNTVLVPGILSWTLPNALYLKTSLLALLNNASSSPSNPPANGGVGAGNGFSSWMPELAVSWLKDNWNITADMYYSFNNKNKDTGYKTGQIFEADYTAMKTMGKWGAGLGAYQVYQVTSDTGPLAADCEQSGCKARRFGIGPLVSYQFGGLNLSAQYARDLSTRNAMGAQIFNVRMIVPFQ
ncbi:MAG: hypothetical protein EPO09_16540 [Aquabacterium sp.]|uniref:SphA family protein n=1 Tax=Aquabacterium sp. TaxID=1872578 RepID=UPI0011FC68A0|nr:transporter [Aquabacterium sp.]TAK90833.1 MAG: hypothetical protein EPO09_16540 [Aquabacterium sp.]